MYHCYHVSNSRECMGVNGEALRLHAVYKKLYFLLQVTQESISGTGTTSHMRSSERAMKLKVRMTKSLSPWYQAIPEKYHSFVAIGIVARAAHSAIQTATNL